MPTFNHVMLDLETLSLRADACIVQIAAIAFDIETGELGPRFNRFVNESSLVGARVGHIDVSTVGFWMRQKFGPTLGAKITSEDDALPLGNALAGFNQWFANLAEDTCEDDVDPRPTVETSEDVALWSHGAGFDIPILASAFDRALGEVPWQYRAPRDTRTLFALAPGGMPRPPKDAAREHDAEYDCEYQIAQVCAAWRRVTLANAALQRHETGMSEVLDKIVALGLAEAPGMSFDQREDADLLGPNMYAVDPIDGDRGL